ncbi:alpha/beta hydrolase [Frankia sp. Mgl5]|uniref:alpha/beta hydrolase family protein n=1 Tax=Frankia sp. Mgl5 TaxID=2933793 RepID=UPI00200FA848|nr:alpha/beta family hydrolase [Frankia sp. Mgl5]MCK9926118.1 alpha/beta hydrolase [Frankia sp. Mgl5]
MRGTSHAQGEILTDVRADHAVSFPGGSDGSDPAEPPAPVRATATAGEDPLLVDGGRLRVVPVPPRAEVVGTVVLLHGAGSGTDTPALTALAERLTAAGIRVAALEMPYRVAGRRAPDRPARLDAVLTAAVAALGPPDRLALAGASMGSRVAVRCARAVGARAVLALGFPLEPPGGKPSRGPELAGAGVPVLVVQGSRDAFGMPVADPSRGIRVHVVAGADHSFRVRVRDGRPVGEVIGEAAEVGASWLLARLGDEPSGTVGHELRDTVGHEPGGMVGDGPGGTA